ncbi:MAG TPA: S1C family serine protease, partial [Gammaproteobacteria bacterium]
MSDTASTGELLSEETLASLVGIEAHIPDDALSAGVLGTERSGHGVRIRDDGLIVAIGYVVNDAEEIWIRSPDGAAAPGVIVGNDYQSGLALIRPSSPLAGPTIEIGPSDEVRVGDAVMACASHESDPQIVDAQVVARQEFAGRWEYVLDNAIFTAPPHPSWSGAALLDIRGRLCGIGSLVIQGFDVSGSLRTVNMFVPVDLIVPVIDEICAHGKRLAPARPWLGFLVHEEDGELTIVGVYRNCPADNAGLRPGDIVLEVNDQPVDKLST